MRKKINKIFTDLVQYYKNIENVEETINEELQTKPACVHMSERVNEYENIHMHKYYEVLYVEKGSISYLIDDEEYKDIYAADGSPFYGSGLRGDQA